MEVLEAIAGRRSVRKYKADMVDDRTLEKVLEAARWSPSWANTQCWRFVVVRDRETIIRLAETAKATNRGAVAMKDAPLAIVACAVLGKAGYKNGELVTDKGDWFMFDVAIAMQNMVLAAHSLGLGTVYIGYFDAVKTAEIIGLPQGLQAVAMTPLGYPDEEPKATPRKELSDIVFYEKYMGE